MVQEEGREETKKIRASTVLRRAWQEFTSVRDFDRDSREAMDYEKTEILRNHALSYELNFLYVFQEMQKSLKKF